MKRVSNSKRFNAWQLWVPTVALIANASGCAGEHATALHNFKPSVGLSALSDETLNCETSLRTKMEAEGLAFSDIAPLHESIQNASSSYAGLEKKTYEFLEKQSQIQQISMHHVHVLNGAGSDLGYELAVNDGESANPMSLTIKYQTTSPALWTQLQQKFQVTSACELKLSQTSLEKLEQAGSEVKYTNNTYYADGTNDQKNDTAQVPANHNLSNFWLTPNDQPQFKDGDTQYLPGLGVVTVQLSGTSTESQKRFGLDLHFSRTSANVNFNGSLILSASESRDDQASVSYETLAQQTIWMIPRSLWSTLKLGVAANPNQVEMKLPHGYLDTHPNFRVVTNELPKYDHLKAYFSITPAKAESTTSGQTYNLVENRIPQINDQTSSVDLESNDTIDTTFPEIQKVASDIATQAPNNRLKQIELILKFLQMNYSYDYAMAANNVIHPMKVSDALSRRTGVCQHYAVIFTTLARALKIPSRIVVGFLMTGETAGNHAWVEAEVAPGTWQVIEPQLGDGLTGTHTRFYFPVARARMLEGDFNATAATGLAFINTQLTILPAL